MASTDPVSQPAVVAPVEPVSTPTEAEAPAPPAGPLDGFLFLVTLTAFIGMGGGWGLGTFVGASVSGGRPGFSVFDFPAAAVLLHACLASLAYLAASNRFGAGSSPVLLVAILGALLGAVAPGDGSGGERAIFSTLIVLAAGSIATMANGRILLAAALVGSVLSYVFVLRMGDSFRSIDSGILFGKFIAGAGYAALIVAAPTAISRFRSIF